MSKSPPPECLNKCAFCRSGSKTGAAIRNQLAAGPLASHGLAGEWPCPFGRGDVATVTRKATDIARGALARFTGPQGLTEAQVKERWGICQGCDHSKASGGTVCGKLRDALKPSSPACGCIIRNKIQLANQACPLGKWLALTAGP